MSSDRSDVVIIHIRKRKIETRILGELKKVLSPIKEEPPSFVLCVFFFYLTRNQSFVAFFTFQTEPMPVFAQRRLPLGWKKENKKG